MPKIYWITTGFISAYLLLSSYSYLFSASTIEGIRDLGFPDFFRIQLAVLKVIAALLLIIPQIPNQLKEWGYAGTFFFMLTAIVAHFAHKDPIALNIVNLVLIGILAASYNYFKI